MFQSARGRPAEYKELVVADLKLCWAWEAVLGVVWRTATLGGQRWWRSGEMEKFEQELKSGETRNVLVSGCRKTNR